MAIRSASSPSSGEPSQNQTRRLLMGESQVVARFCRGRFSYAKTVSSRRTPQKNSGKRSKRIIPRLAFPSLPNRRRFRENANFFRKLAFVRFFSERSFLVGH